MPRKVDYDEEDANTLAFWGLFARVKYWAAKKSPRAEGKRPDDLQRAAELLRDSLEMCWRAGYKGEQLAC